MGWPADKRILIKSLAANSQYYNKQIQQVGLLGGEPNLAFERTENGLVVLLPENSPGQVAVALKILS